MSSHSAASEFWQSRDEYHDLAQKVEQNIELEHPAAVTGRSAGCGFCYHCGWCATNIIYYDFEEPPV